MLIAGALGTLIMLPFVFFRAEILGLLFHSVDKAVMEAADTYLLITAMSFPALAIYNAGTAIFRSMAKTKTTMYVSGIMNIVNITGDLIGVFMLHAGAAGVAVPSLLSRTLAAVIMMILCAGRGQAVGISAKNVFIPEYDMFRRILRIAVPNGVENALLEGSKVILSVFIAMFGTAQIAASGVGQNFWSVAALFSIVMMQVFVTVIGQCAGAGDYDAADYYIHKLLRITWIGCALWDTFFQAVRMNLNKRS